MDRILNHIDCFDREARLNESVDTVFIFCYSDYDKDDDDWDKLGQAIGTR
jgi:hypothetical protein